MISEYSIEDGTDEPLCDTCAPKKGYAVGRNGRKHYFPTPVKQ